MANLNENFQNLSSFFLFKEIEERCLKLKEKDPDISFINLGIGDTTSPISKNISKAISKAARELTKKKSFKGYRPSQGELFLREKIKIHDYKDLGISEDEIFISSGIKPNISFIQELFSKDNIVAIPNPTYPVYLDSNIIAGRLEDNIVYLNCLEKNNFLPLPPEEHVDIIYLCSPCNPTGCAYTKDNLEKWVDYAKREHSIIFFDGAYESFITNKNSIKSIYEIRKAKEVAIEFRSFSKRASFSSLRLSYCVIPKEITRENFSLNHLWKRFLDAKVGAVSYPIQKGGEAIFLKTSQKKIKKHIFSCLKNAKILKKGLKKLGFKVFGGEDSPYIWCKTLNNLSSFNFFDLLLEKANIITIPGVGFGECGEEFMRFSAFATKADIKKALKRIKKLKKNFL